MVDGETSNAGMRLASVIDRVELEPAPPRVTGRQPHTGILCCVCFFLCVGAVGCWTQFDANEQNGDGGPDGDSDTDTDSDVGISDVSVSVHHKVNTILVVRWNLEDAADEIWLRYTFENNEWYESPPRDGNVGYHQEVVLGIPENTNVTIHIVASTGAGEFVSEAYTGATENVPSGFPTPTIEIYNAALAAPHRWLLGAVEATPGDEENYSGPFWLFVMDRQGRILWYYSNIGDNPILTNVRVSRDNKFIFFANRRPWGGYWGFVPKVTKMTLDWEFFEEIELDLSDNADMTDDGSILYNTDGHYAKSAWLRERLPSGEDRPIWNCSSFMGWDCYSNTVNWNPLHDTVLLSFPYPNTVVEIDRKSGDLVGVYGDHSKSYEFDPPSWEFEFQHYANITRDGTLMVSSHMPDSYTDHAFIEFEIDRENEVLRERWYYNGGNEWANAMGEAYKIDNGGGNVLCNYGTGGVIKEITNSGQVAWQVKFDATWPNDTNNKMVGHTTLIDDLYALCEGF